MRRYSSSFLFLLPRRIFFQGPVTRINGDGCFASHEYSFPFHVVFILLPKKKKKKILSCCSLFLHLTSVVTAAAAATVCVVTVAAAIGLLTFGS